MIKLNYSKTCITSSLNSSLEILLMSIKETRSISGSSLRRNKQRSNHHYLSLRKELFLHPNISEESLLHQLDRNKLILMRMQAEIHQNDCLLSQELNESQVSMELSRNLRRRYSHDLNQQSLIKVGNLQSNNPKLKISFKTLLSIGTNLNALNSHYLSSLINPNTPSQRKK